jgi:hypothetical protein
MDVYLYVYNTAKSFYVVIVAAASVAVAVAVAAERAH